MSPLPTPYFRKYEPRYRDGALCGLDPKRGLDPIRAEDLPRAYSEREVLLRCLLAAIAAGPLWIIAAALLLTFT